MKITKDLIEKITLILFAFFGIVVSFLDYTGWLTEIKWFDGKIPATSLLLLSILIIYIAFAAPEKSDSHHKEIMDAIKQIDLLGGRVKVFQDFDECLKYTKLRIVLAKTTVMGVYSDINLNLFKSAQSSILYREIILADSIGNPTLQPHFQLRKNSGSQNYKCAVFEMQDGVYHQFVVIDQSEVIFLSSLSSSNIAVAHPKIVDLLRFHFDEIERKATKIK